MITIALDEGGRFEEKDLYNYHKCMFIGGIVFHYKTQKDCRSELDRIQQYLKNTCTSRGLKYPDDLHYNRIEGAVVNGESANIVKNDLMATLPDFLNGKGEWEKNAPNGTYYLYALLGDKKSSPKVFAEEESNLLSDKKVCNRYEHMAYRAIENLLFFNPRLNDKEISLDLATRTIPSENKKFGDELKEAGYEKLSKKDMEEDLNGKEYFRVTHPGSFRSAIATTIQSSQKTDLHFDMKVQSIYYREGSTNFYQGFLYLADTICSLYEDLLGNCNNAESAISTLWLKGKEYVRPNYFYLWTYNDFDQAYRELYKAFESKDLYKTLRLGYSLSKKNESNYEVYNTLWLSEIEGKILKADERYTSNFKRAINELEADVTNYQISASEARYVYELLRPQAMELCKKDEQALFALYKTELAINNHEGSYEKAKSSFCECMNYSKNISMEDCFELRNRYSVCLCDAREYDEAIRFTEETREWAGFIKAAKESIYGNGTLYTYLGRVESQLGQCFAFNNDAQSAFIHFGNALKEFTDIGNKKITQSYMLHAYIEAGNEAEYSSLAADYFGSANRTEQMLSILEKINDDPIANSFALYVYLKAFYVFYTTNIKKQELEKAIHHLDSLRNFEKSNVHPWEMIYKYIAFLCALVGNSDYRTKGHDYINKAKSCLENKDGVLTDIVNEIDVQYASVLQGRNAFENSRMAYMYR